MKVTTMIGATGAYACIVKGQRTLDVLLSPGRSAFVSLRESAQELREKAAKLQDRAALMEEAAELLRSEKEHGRVAQP
jgi:hypothetical protein